jgi:hypothetical protein
MTDYKSLKRGIGITNPDERFGGDISGAAGLMSWTNPNILKKRNLIELVMF